MDKYRTGGRLSGARYPEAKPKLVRVTPTKATRVMDGLIWGAVIVVAVVIVIAIVL